MDELIDIAKQILEKLDSIERNLSQIMEKDDIGTILARIEEIESNVGRIETSSSNMESSISNIEESLSEVARSADNIKELLDDDD